MPTCTAPMRNDALMRKCENSQMRKGRALIRSSACSHITGFTMTELVVVLVIISLFVVLAVANFSRLLGRSTFRAQASELVSTMQMAAAAASESNKRYEVIIDIAQQSYTLRQITSPQLPSDVLEEEIIVKNDFGENCRVVYVLFDDLTETDSEHQKAFFRVGRSGWQAGGKIVLLDKNEQPYSVIIDRMSIIVALREGDVDILRPKRQDEVPF